MLASCDTCHSGSSAKQDIQEWRNRTPRHLTCNYAYLLPQAWPWLSNHDECSVAQVYGGQKGTPAGVVALSSSRTFSARAWKYCRESHTVSCSPGEHVPVHRRS